MSKDVAEILHDVKMRGYGLNFEIDGSEINCREKRTCFQTGQITLIEEIHAGRGSDPGDEATIMLLETESGLRGFLILPNPAATTPQELEVIARIRKG